MSGSMLPITTMPNGFSGSGGSFSIIDFSHDILNTFFLCDYSGGFYTRNPYLTFYQQTNPYHIKRESKW
jgi:hypothetical protein